MNGTTPPQAAVRQRYVLSVLVRHILAMTMALCMALAILDAASLLGGGLHVELIVVLCLLVSIEAMYAYHVLTHVSAYGRNWVLYRVSEWVVILVVLKAALYFTRGFDQFALDLLSWQQDFTQFFMDGEFVVGILILAVVWGLSTLFAHDLDELDVDPRRLEVEREAGLHIERASSRQQLTDHVLIAGGAIVLLMALSKLPALLSSGGVPSPEPVPFYAVLYFAAGLGLFGITQFTLLRTGWLWDRLKISSGLGWRWLAYGALFLAATLVVALLLPTGYSVGLLGAIGYLISLLVTLVQVIFFLFLQLLFLVASLIASLLGQSPPEQPRAPVQPALPPPPPPQTPTASEPWLEVVKSIVFWALLLGIVLYSLSQLLQQRRDWLIKLRELPGLLKLLRGWQRLWAGLRGLNRQFVARIAAGLQARRSSVPAGAGSPGRGYVGLRRLSPRQQVMYFYLAMIQRGGQRGLVRKASQTPYEYATKLHATLPDVDEDVAAITQEFVEARYSAHDITPEHVSAARRYWERIKAALRNLRRPG